MTDLLLVGAITRDQIRLPNLRWTQPGGAPWHAGLALAASDPETRTRITLLGQAGPWARAFALPALGAAALAWAGPDSVQDTYFINDYQPDRRRQALQTQARPLLADDLPTICQPPSLLRRSIRSRSTPLCSPVYSTRELRGAGRAGPFATPGRAGAGSHPADRRRTTPARRVGDQVLQARVRGRRTGPGAGGGRASSGGDDGSGGARHFWRARRPPGYTDSDLADRFDQESGVETPSLDTTGAGDVFLAGYVLARSRGAAPVDALALGTRAAGDLVRDRVRDGRRRQRVAAMRRLHAIAAWAQRRLMAEAGLPSESDDLFASDGPLSLMLAPHFPSSPLAALHEADRRSAARPSLGHTGLCSAGAGPKIPDWLPEPC